MSKSKVLISAALALAALAGTSAAHAGDVHWSVGINLPAVGTVISNAPVHPGYPSRVHYEPAPVYYQPAPVYYAPPPVVVRRPVVVYQPAPGYYAQPRVSYDRGEWHPRHRHGHREHQRHGWDRDGDRRDDDRRGGGHDHRR